VRRAGRQYDGTGKLTPWWSPSAVEKFQDRADCLINQYSQVSGSFSARSCWPLICLSVLPDVESDAWLLLAG
jgi:predicted metalloendopeptidase